MKAVYAYRDDIDFMLTFMGILPANYASVGEWVEKLDDEEAWPESHYALYIDLETFSVAILDEDDTPQEVGGWISVADILETAVDRFYAREAK